MKKSMPHAGDFDFSRGNLYFSKAFHSLLASSGPQDRSMWAPCSRRLCAGLKKCPRKVLVSGEVSCSEPKGSFCS